MMEKILIPYLLVMNLFGFCLMGWDKRQACKKAYRIPEKQLFLISVLGGSVGTWWGMYFFHHKTKHWYFVWGMPLILVLHLGVAYLLFVK